MVLTFLSAINWKGKSMINRFRFVIQLMTSSKLAILFGESLWPICNSA
uniref:Uncharacterized protein n=1 Tax=Rhizophora mucronata TaxID=61149 RepID=A0A2P2J0V4_RHIMU